MKPPRSPSAVALCFALWACAPEALEEPPVLEADHDVLAGDPDPQDDAPADPGPDPADPEPADAQPACPTSTLTAGDSTGELEVGGVTRTYLVHVPASYDGDVPVPLVFDFHPLGVSASTWTLATGWTSVSEREGFILVRPQGYEDSWRVGRCCDPAMSAVDDVAFVRALVAALSRAACIDPARVYATGCSNGGGMSYKLACDAADLVAAIAPVDFDCLTGPTNSPSCGGCAPSRPISTLQFRGLLDPLVPYWGGPTSVVQGIEFPGAEANFATWGGINQCTGSPAARSDHAGCQSYPSCGGGVETTLCTMTLGTHCADYASFEIADVAWEMFERQTLP